MEETDFFVSEVLNHIKCSNVNIPGINHENVIDFQIIAQLGSGCYGDVYEVELTTRENTIRCAMKAQAVSTNALTEIDINLRLSGVEGMCRFYGFICTQIAVYLFMELLKDSITLSTYIETNPIRDPVEIAISLVKCVAALHKSGITHNDLFGNTNILYGNEKITIIDFGLARYRGAELTIQHMQHDIKKITDIIAHLFGGRDLVSEITDTNSSVFCMMTTDEILEKLYSLR